VDGLDCLHLLFAIVLVETLRQKPVYRAKALLEIDKENPSLVTPQELFQLDEVTDTIWKRSTRFSAAMIWRSA